MDITKTTRLVAGLGMLIFAGGAFADGWDPESNAGSQGSIANTRHNMTMDYDGTGTGVGFNMDGYRNDYGAVCIYCHTPHGANQQIQAPLWNRTVALDSVYTIYDKPTTLMRTMSTPGPTSLTCLSCHDGTIAIDSVLNMPGSGRNPVDNSENISVGKLGNTSFLDQWRAGGNIGPPPGTHATLGPELGASGPSNTCAQPS